MKLEFGILLKELNIFQQKLCTPQPSLFDLPCHKMLLLVKAELFFILIAGVSYLRREISMRHVCRVYFILFTNCLLAGSIDMSNPRHREAKFL
jgi:hypothetical protein